MPRILKTACLLGLLATLAGCEVVESALERFGRSDGEFDNGPLFATSLGSRISLNVLTPDDKIALLHSFSSLGDISEDAISPGRNWVHYGGGASAWIRDTALSGGEVMIFQLIPSSGFVIGAANAARCDLANLEGDVTTTVETMLQDRLGINEVPPYEVEVARLITDETDTFELGGLSWIGWLSDSELVVSAYAGILVEVTFGATGRDSFSYFQSLSDLQYLTLRQTGGGEDGWETVACAPVQPAIPPVTGPASILSLDGSQLLINGSPAIVARTEDIVYADSVFQVSREVARRVRP